MLEPAGPISERPMSNLEKVHFIVGYAILRPSLRSAPASTSPQSARPTPSLAASPWPRLPPLPPTPGAPPVLLPVLGLRAGPQDSR